MAGIPRLDDDSVDRLSELLEERVVPKGGMSLEMLDGFLSALVVTPDLVPPSEYLPCIWNDEQIWETPQEAEEALGLVMALWNDIVRRATAPLPEEDTDDATAQSMLESASPLMAFPDDIDLSSEEVLAEHADLPLGVAWANGFMMGVSLRGELWDHWADEDEEVADDLADISQMALFSQEQIEEAGAEDIELPTLAERLEMAGEIPFMLADLNWKRLERQRPTPARRPDLPGRNDPCPCGSGLKFKKCCGAPGKLN
ncbi:UPF0149 family protein [Pseudomarimonas salicorniae]|uniref:UPF0149 family protein n=1 Tax=Pseudomarimonas salicorniae TaxID=2933270 RepID=A0ABT0GFQ3_9GAMM|nr:UPF0149 family protein [Lysobacter sp. CAU 1642]MCK7593366.1 UPF0149 family protein [Lysobacter sp. CAU 1642]